MHALLAEQAIGCCLQVVKSTKQAQQRKAKAGGGPSYADDAAAADAPQRWSDYTVHFEFPEPTELPPPLIQLNDVSFQYPGRDDFGLKDLNIGVDMGSRVAIVGPNGAGKTTLMNLLAGLPAASPSWCSPVACDNICMQTSAVQTELQQSSSSSSRGASVAAALSVVSVSEPDA